MSSYKVPILSLLTINVIYLSPLSVSQSCGPRMSPRLLMEIPCDMTKSSFCTLPGSAYPWSSVRRYIYENQGFMRRMYGEQRQSQVLRNEIEEVRDKYDSIYFYGRERVHSGLNSFNMRSLNDDNYQQLSSSTPVSFDYSSTVNESNRETPNDTSVANEAELKETLDRALPEDDETTTIDSSQDDMITTTDSNDEQNEMSKASADFISSSQTTTYSSSTSSATSATNADTNADQNEKKEKKGVNACPIKEEVIAPYWANNTRGETLALLNVYPFEQYIHWEKCAYENSQMFCRNGCRCEQQYRLHRLLAFDPKNDCRGIFADWFRFPGCCVCICYDLPDSLRVNRRRARL